jgi:hypothetical protein
VGYPKTSSPWTRKFSAADTKLKGANNIHNS